MRSTRTAALFSGWMLTPCFGVAFAVHAGVVAALYFSGAFEPHAARSRFPAVEVTHEWNVTVDPGREPLNIEEPIPEPIAPVFLVEEVVLAEPTMPDWDEAIEPPPPLRDASFDAAAFRNEAVPPRRPPPPQLKPSTPPPAEPAAPVAKAAAPPPPSTDTPSEGVFEPARKDPKHSPLPHYPASAQERGVKGLVVLEVAVDAAGRPEDVIVAASSGHALLDKAALAAVKAWRFVPARQSGVAIPSRFRLPIRFGG